MNTYLLNRAILNRDALDDNQRKAMFARLGGGSGGGGGWKGAAKRGWDKIKQGVSEMGRLPTPEESLNKLESDAQGRDALIRSALAFTPAGAGVAIDDMMHARKPSDLALASLGALPFAGGLGDDVARGMSAAHAPLSKNALLGKFRDALRHIADEATDFPATQKIGTQARRNELAAALRRDRELKRLDLHPEQFRTTQPSMSASERRLRSAAARNPSAPAAEFGYMGGGTIGERVARIEREAKAYQAAKATARGHRPGETLALYDNRMPPARSEEERRRRAYFASMSNPMKGEARKWHDRAEKTLRQADVVRQTPVRGPNDVNPQPANGFLDWALQEQRPGGPAIQPNPRNPYDTPEARGAQLVQQYTATLPPHVNPNPPGSPPQPMPRPQRVQSINDAASLVAYFRRQFPAGGDLLGAREIEALQANPDDAGSLQSLHASVRQTLENVNWTNDTTALSPIEQARRSGIGKALAVLHAHGLMTDYYAYSRRSDGAPNFSQNPGTQPLWGGMMAKPVPGNVMRPPTSRMPPPSQMPGQSPQPPTSGGPAPITGQPGTRPQIPGYKPPPMAGTRPSPEQPIARYPEWGVWRPGQESTRPQHPGFAPYSDGGTRHPTPEQKKTPEYRQWFQQYGDWENSQPGSGRRGGPAPVRGMPGTIPVARKHDSISRAISTVRGIR